MLDRILIGSSAEPSDPNFKNVTLLLHGDGSNGAQNNTFLDSSTNNFTITRNGNTTQGSFSPYGSNWSNYFDGTGDYLTVPANTAFAFGTGDFTVEFWFNAASYRTSGPYYDCFLALGNFANSPYFRINQDGRLTAGITATNEYYTTSTVTLNRWTHFAVTRQGSTVRLFVNGVLETTQTNSTNLLNTTDVTVGTSAWQAANETFTGYLSNVRVLKGTALYTSTFTPSTTPLTAITNTSLLTCQGNRFRDASTNNFTITRNGDVKVTNFAPFAPSAAYSTTTNGGSAYFDGTGDYLQTPSNTAFTFSGSLTIEFWINFSSTPSNYVALVAGTTANTQLFITTKIDGTGLRFGLSGVAEYATGSQTWAAGAWYHVALVRNGTDVRFYVNGVNVTDGTATNSTSYSGAFLLGGNVGGTVNFPGYISNLRIVKDTAVYTAAFTPPSSPVTAITNTQLLLNATNAAIFDNSMKNDLETVGNAQISTSVKKFGTGSIYVPSGGGCALIPNSQPLTLGTGNWTIEFWAYTDASGTKVYMDLLNVANTVIYGEMYSVGTTLYWYRNSSNFITGTGALTANTWQHIAVAKSGTSTKLFVNGTQVGSTLTDSFDYASARWEIGGRSDLTLPIVGYIDDLRITNGVARYTANFTAPTAPFPNK